MLFFESNGRPIFKSWPEQFFNQLIDMSDVLVMFGGVFLQLFYFQGKFAVIQRPFPYLHKDPHDGYIHLDGLWAIQYRR